MPYGSLVDIEGKESSVDLVLYFLNVNNFLLKNITLQSLILCQHIIKFVFELFL